MSGNIFRNVGKEYIFEGYVELNPSQLIGIAESFAFRLRKGTRSAHVCVTYGGTIGGPTCFHLGTMDRPCINARTYTCTHTIPST